MVPASTRPECFTASSPVGATTIATSAPRTPAPAGILEAPTTVAATAMPSMNPTIRIRADVRCVVLRRSICLRPSRDVPSEVERAGRCATRPDPIDLLVLCLPREVMESGCQTGRRCVVLQRQREPVDDRVVLVPRRSARRGTPGRRSRSSSGWSRSPDSVSVKIGPPASATKPVQFGNAVAPGMVPLSIDRSTYGPIALIGVVV